MSERRDNHSCDNQEMDPLEAELKALRPIPLDPLRSADLARRLDPSASRPWMWAAATMGLAAACIAILVIHGRIAHRLPGLMEGTVARAPERGTQPAMDDRLWSLANYQQTLSKSPAALDSLLDRQATDWGGVGSFSQVASVGDFVSHEDGPTSN